MRHAGGVVLSRKSHGRLAERPGLRTAGHCVAGSKARRKEVEKLWKKDLSVRGISVTFATFSKETGVSARETSPFNLIILLRSKILTTHHV